MLLTVSAAGALAAVLLVPSASSASLLQRLPQTGRGRPFSRSRSTRNVRAPGDNGVGGHGIGGQLCWYEINKESGLGEWTCPPSVAAQPARRARLFDFGVTAPAEGYAYAGALPPTDWGDENFDGANFAAFSVEDSDMTGVCWACMELRGLRLPSRLHSVTKLGNSLTVVDYTHIHTHVKQASLHTRTWTGTIGDLSMGEYPRRCLWIWMR